MPLHQTPSFEYILPDLTTIPLPTHHHHHHPSPAPSLTTLPPELHALIIPHLPYPDALALKHTCHLFYHAVDTSIRQKVSWLVDRHARGLPCPQKKCIMKTDALFCRGEVKALMERRRRHQECGTRGCEVVVGRECDVSERKARRMGMPRGRFECMGILIDPRLVYLAVLMVCFSTLVNVFVGMRIYQMRRGERWWRTSS
ncbi:MAG: hypothetical protein LQ339_001684 [Xanthoria mediterranea]|nr:MAG: hypothetical protein LQ339_001684 [Xanthoria mediterranea]